MWSDRKKDGSHIKTENTFRCSCADPGIFVRGEGVQVSLTKSSDNVVFFFILLSPQLILQKSNGKFQRNLSFFKVPEGV